MKAHYKTADGRLVFEVTGETTKDLFAGIASVQEIFEAEKKCKLCGCEELRFVHRVVDDYHFYELRCTKSGCYAQFSFGQAKKGGGLFPKRRDDDGNFLEGGGWKKWVKRGTQAQPAARANGPAAPPATEGYTYEPADDDVPF